MKARGVLLIGAISILALASCKQATLSDGGGSDTVAPTIGAALSFAGTSSEATTVSWGAASDDATATADLQYLLVKAASAGAIDTIAEAGAVTGVDLAMDWTAGALSHSVSGLSPGTSYYFAVLVKDASGNTSLYAPQIVATSTISDNAAPTPGAAISFSGTTCTATTVSWGAASDDVSPAASLQYKLVKASDAASIDTLAEADSMAGADLVMNWTAGAVTKTTVGLSAGTSYFFAVLVKDAAGNMSLYAPRSVSTLTDASSPTIGTSIVFSETSSTATTVAWGAASDNVTTTSALRYKLVWASASPFIETVSLANAAVIENGGISMDWTTNALSRPVNGLSAATLYYFAILVQDEAGNISLYAPKAVTTSATADTTPPVAGAAISFAGTSSSATTVSWGSGTDNVTSASNLRYKLAMASASASLDTIAKVNASTGGSLVMDWTANALSKTTVGLTAGTTYWFAVLVQDTAGNLTLYAPRSVTTASTPDTVPPTAGAAITYSGTASTVTTVNWGAASDDVTPAASLQYKLLRASDSAAIDTVSEANAIAGANLIMDWTANATSASATGLIVNTSYWFAVLVKDAVGNMSLYAPQSVTTGAASNLHYDLSSNPGWVATGDWEWGTVSNIGPIGAKCYGTKIAGEYSLNTTWANNYIQSGPLNLSSFAAATGFRMTFKAYFDLDCSYDIAVLQYSTDGANFAFVSAERVSSYPYVTNLTTFLLGWSPNQVNPGDEPGWKSIVVDLGGIGLNGKTAVYFRWALSSDESNVGPGFYIDDIDIGY